MKQTLSSRPAKQQSRAHRKYTQTRVQPHDQQQLGHHSISFLQRTVNAHEMKTGFSRATSGLKWVCVTDWGCMREPLLAVGTVTKRDPSCLHRADSQGKSFCRHTQCVQIKYLNIFTCNRWYGYMRQHFYISMFSGSPQITNSYMGEKSRIF